jgi:RNA polymerase sigma-70 factor, ECF subfamily
MQESHGYIASELQPHIVGSNSTPDGIENVLSQRLPYFYRTAYKFLGNSADAEDAVQEALLSAYKHLGEFRGQSQMSTWLTVIVNNAARMQLRRRPRYLHVSLDEPFGQDHEFSLSSQFPDNRPNPEDDYRDAELKTQLRKLAAQLSPSLRQTYQLRDVDGLSIREAANILDVSIGTVKARSSRARAKLKQLMRKAVAAQGCRIVARTSTAGPIANKTRGKATPMLNTFECEANNG